jgi:hypothetical protein
MPPAPTIGSYSGSRYGAIAAACALILLLMVAAFNAVVDPFGMVLLIDSPTLNARKPGIYTRVRLFKAYEIARVRPQTIILGTSRSHIGFSCGHEALKRLDGPCYNLAFDGATSREMYAYLRHAYAVRPLKHVFLGLEPYHLAPSFSTVRPDFDPLVLRNPEGNAVPRWLSGDLRLLISLDTLKTSIETLEAQAVPEPTWFAPDGQRLGEVFFRQIDGRFRQLGPRGYFDLTDQQEVGYQTEWMISARRKHAVLRADPPPDPNEASLAYVRRIVEFCRTHRIDLRIVVTPAHAHQLEIMAASSDWTELEKKKRDLVRIVDEENSLYPDSTPTPIVDFSGYSSITEEAPPAPGSRSELRYYWDSSHFKAIVGDYVLDRVYGVSSPARQIPPDFGVRLTATSIERYLVEQRARQADYRRRFPDDVARLRALVARALHNDAEDPAASFGLYAERHALHNAAPTASDVNVRP